jgi:1-acyl-sn-glycerol-3-phosphate acyltransferase
MNVKIKQYFLNFYFWFMFTMVTMLFFVILPLYLFISIIFLKHKIDATLRKGIVIYGWILVTIVPFFAPVKVESRVQKMPLPAIVVANHSSAVDPFLFGALLIDACFIATWPFKIPIYGFLMRLAKYVSANDGWEKVCQKCTLVLKSGTSVIIWPEGHRSKDGCLGRFRNGAFSLAVQTGFPILPVCIVGSGKFLPPSKKMMSPSKIKLVILNPIYPDPRNNQEEEIIRMRKAAKGAIQKVLDENNQRTDAVPYLKSFERGEKC